MRVTWNGSLSFGLVSIPVGLAPATKPAARQSDVSFRLLHRECLTPIKQKRWCPKHDREVTPDELVKGWEVAKGQFVVVEEAELEALERHDDSRTIDIERFVPLADVDPVWMDRTYFLVPGAAPAQRRPYKLLLEAMEEAGVGAIGRLVRSGRESLCLVRVARQRARARDAVPRRGRLLAGRDRRGDGCDRREEPGARARTPDRPGPRGGVRPGGALERLSPRPPRRCSRRSCAARRSRSPSRSPSPRRRSTSSRRSRRASPPRRRRRRVPRRPTRSPKATRPARKAARK